MKIFKTLLLLQLFVLATASCKQEDQDALGIDNGGAAISFKDLTSNEVSSAYVLSVESWEHLENGINIFRHAIDDVYKGLEASTSGEPISDLRFLLSKNIAKFENYLGFDGTFSTQTLNIKLPHELFFTGAALAELTYDATQYSYSYRQAESDIEIAADYSIDADGAVTVEVTEKGTIIVRPILSLQITGPAPYPGRYFNDIDASLRTFTWPNDGGVATCSLDGGLSYGNCTSSTSLVLSVADFNNHPVIQVKVSKDGYDNIATLDLGEVGGGYSSVQFFACTSTINSMQIDTITVNGPNPVLCLRPGTYSRGAGSELMLDGVPNVKIIGHHDPRPVITGAGTLIDATQTAALSDMILANLDIQAENSGPTESLIFSNTDFGGSVNGESSIQFSNIKFSHIGIAAGRLTNVSSGISLYFYDSHLENTKSTLGTLLELKNGKVELFGTTLKSNGTGPLLKLNGSGSILGALTSKIIASTFISEGVSAPGIWATNSGTENFPSHLIVADSTFETFANGIKVNEGTTFSESQVIQINNSRFIHSGLNANSAPAIDILFSTTKYTLRGDNNIFCAVDPDTPSKQFSMAVSLNSSNNLTPAQWSGPATFDEACPAF